MDMPEDLEPRRISVEKWLGLSEKEKVDQGYLPPSDDECPLCLRHWVNGGTCPGAACDICDDYEEEDNDPESEE